MKKIIFASSGGAVYGNVEQLPIREEIYPNPVSLYAVQKFMVEGFLQYIARMKSINTIILRISNPYGRGQKPYTGQGIIATFLASNLEGKAVEIWGDGNCIRDYIYIDDLSECIEQCINKNLESGIYNVGSGKGTSIFEICKKIEELTGRPMSYVLKEAGPAQVNNNVLDCTKINDAIGWRYSVELSEGLKRCI